MAAKRAFAVCTENSGYEVSLELRKIYEVLPDLSAAAHGHVRIIDESGEDYLYPESFFTSIDLPQKAIQQIFDAACQAGSGGRRWSRDELHER